MLTYTLPNLVNIGFDVLYVTHYSVVMSLDYTTKRYSLCSISQVQYSVTQQAAEVTLSRVKGLC